MSIPKIWNGTAWADIGIKTWKGSSWLTSTNFFTWNGSVWLDTQLDSPLESHVLTVGNDSGSVTSGPGFTFDWSYSGYSLNGVIHIGGAIPFGAITPTTSSIYSGAALTDLYTNDNANTLVLKITGATNSGWTALYIDKAPYLRASATYSSGLWSWTNANVSWSYPTTTIKFL
jgi:hypothetical protein